MVHLNSFLPRIHLPCYAALRVRPAAPNVRFPFVFRAIVTIGETGTRALRRFRDEVVVTETKAAPLRAMPARGGGGVIHECCTGQGGGQNE